MDGGNDDDDTQDIQNNFDQYAGQSLEDEGPDGTANQTEEGDYNPYYVDDEQTRVPQGSGDGGDGEDDSESVYMIDGVVMKMIQIEGEKNQYLMDPQGRIYDMQANFIGTANTQGLEEMATEGVEEDDSQVQDEQL